jgi:hypothetical protein
MGKRASELMENNEEILQDVQGEENPAFVFTGPRSEYKPERPPKLSPQQYDTISRVIRQWVMLTEFAQYQIYFRIFCRFNLTGELKKCAKTTCKQV